MQEELNWMPPFTGRCSECGSYCYNNIKHSDKKLCERARRSEGQQRRRDRERLERWMNADKEGN